MSRTTPSRRIATRAASGRWRAAAALTAAAMVMAATATVVTSPSVSVARADTDPPNPKTPTTVSADALPTEQINGVAWAQVIVGTTVYVTGSFTSARPAGVPAGTDETPRSNLLAYDVTTGDLITSFDHNLNAQGLTIAASPDGSRLYVGGDFTTVDGQPRGHIASFDLPSGGLDKSFRPSLSNRVNAISVSASTVYVGGNFLHVTTQTSAKPPVVTVRARGRLAAFTRAGAPRPWAPSANSEVMSMVVTPNGSKVVVGGKFTAVNKTAAYGIGAVDSTTGRSVRWATNPTVEDSGSSQWISSLTTDGTYVYGTGVNVDKKAAHSDLEGTFSINAQTGAIRWVNDCHGDSYSTAEVGSVMYLASHSHDCTAIGEYPDRDKTEPYHRAEAFTTSPSGKNVGPDNYGFNFNGVPHSALLDWFPELAIGTYTGQNQAAWSVVANSQYVAMAGEFPSVNFHAQQGLVRFAIASVAPNKVGPDFNTFSAPAVSTDGVNAKVSWVAAWDRDNESLSYEVLRDDSSTPIYTTSGNSWFWKRPTFTFTDTTAAPGSTHTYRVRATDPFGNWLLSPVSTPITVGTVPTALVTDLALGRPATQSSTVSGGSASLAVDGNTDGTYADKSVTQTKGTANYDWWQVDLGASSAINKIEIYNRSDLTTRLSKFYVFVSNTPFTTTLPPAEQATEAGGWSYYHAASAKRPTVLGLPAGTTGQYVMVRLAGKNPLNLAEVQVMGPALTPTGDLALNSPAWTSSESKNGVTPDLAVDGNTDGVFADHSVTGTFRTLDSWWQTDLQISQPIGSIAIWNRTDCCSTDLADYWVLVSNTPFNTDLSPAQQATQPGVWSSHQLSTPTPNTVIKFPANTTGRYVLIQNSATSYLDLAEVQVYASTPSP